MLGSLYSSPFLAFLERDRVNLKSNLMNLFPTLFPWQRTLQLPIKRFLVATSDIYYYRSHSIYRIAIICRIKWKKRKIGKRNTSHKSLSARKIQHILQRRKLRNNRLNKTIILFYFVSSFLCKKIGKSIVSKTNYSISSTSVLTLHSGIGIC